MNFQDIKNVLNLTSPPFSNTTFSLLIIVVTYGAAFLLSRNYPKNPNVVILISIPILVCVISVLMHSYDEICAIITDYTRFKLFVMSNFILLAGGVVPLLPCLWLRAKVAGQRKG
uniref:Uncharacterized protein n=1 Tax=Ulva compressa TaxID=63659 RepID=A0A678ZSF4_ULVCO|nr:hypothetical protein [Ulva compressa]